MRNLSSPTIRCRLCAALLCAVLLCAMLLPLSSSAADYWSASDYERQVLLLTNRERLKEGLAPLSSTELLQKAGDIRSVEITELFSHTRPNGTDCFSVLDELPFPNMKIVGENIAAGQNNPSSVNESWMNSPGHKANILTDSFVHLGVGYADGPAPYYKYWVQYFFSSHECRYESMSLIIPAAPQFEPGTSVDEMGITARLTCASCGDCYVPVMDEFCTGYDSDKLGVQSFKVSLLGFESRAEVKIVASGIFKDIPSGSWFEPYVEYVIEAGLMRGVSDTHFDPNGVMTRAMLVTVLWRLEGESPAAPSPFGDLTEDWYKAPVAWAYENGVVSGTSESTFSPNSPITREQLATILYRYTALKGGDTSSTSPLENFPDGPKTSSWARDAMGWAVADGLITGSADGYMLYLDPGGSATRAQVATILKRFCEKQ